MVVVFGIVAGLVVGAGAAVAVHRLRARSSWLALGPGLVVGALWVLEDLAGVGGAPGELLAWAARGMLVAFVAVPLVVMVRAERRELAGPQ